MRRLFLLTLLVCGLAVPAAAPAASGDGTLSVRDGDGRVHLLDLRGALVGRINHGVLEVQVSKAADCDELAVWGAEDERLRSRRTEFGTETICVFSGKRAMRFRLTGSLISVLVRGKDIDLSVVGKGGLMIRGAGNADGAYSVNGSAYASLPEDGSWELLGMAAPARLVP